MPKQRFCKWRRPCKSSCEFSCALIIVIAACLTGCSNNSANRPFFQRSKGQYASNLAKVPPAANPSARAAKHSPGSRDKLKSTADSYLGVPYRWGGQTRKGMDCSGFIRQVYQSAYNITLPHNSGQLAGEGRGVKESRLKKGDIVLFGSLFGIHHAGIYMSDRQFIHASTSKGVIYSSLDEKYYKSKYKGARRIVTN